MSYLATVQCFKRTVHTNVCPFSTRLRRMLHFLFFPNLTLFPVFLLFPEIILFPVFLFLPELVFFSIIFFFQFAHKLNQLRFPHCGYIFNTL